MKNRDNWSRGPWASSFSKIPSKTSSSFHNMNPPRSTLTQHILSKAIGHEQATTVCKACDVLWSWTSIVGVSSLVAATLMMFYQQPAVTEMSMTRTQLPVVYTSVAAPSAYVSVPVQLGDSVTKAVYKVHLRDTLGRTVHEWPALIIDHPALTVPKNGLSFKVPSTLVPGSYYMEATVEYALNPLKVAQLKMDLARIIIDPMVTPFE